MPQPRSERPPTPRYPKSIEREWSRSGVGGRLSSQSSPQQLIEEDASSTGDETVSAALAASRSEPCCGVHLPLRLRSPSSSPHNIELCLHPNWRPLSPTTVIHFVDGGISASQEGLHSPPRSAVACEPIELWRVLDAASVSPPSPSADPRETDSTTSVSSAPSTRLTSQKPTSVPSSRRPPWALNRASVALALAAILLALVAYLVFSGDGYYARVARTTVHETAPLSLWIPFESIYRENIYKLLPVILPLEVDSDWWDPALIIGSLQAEMAELELGIISWEASRIPGPDLTLRDRSASCVEKLERLQMMFISLTRSIPVLADFTSVSVLIHFLSAIRDEQLSSKSSESSRTETIHTHQAIKLIHGTLGFWEERNSAVLACLQRIHGQLGPALEDVVNLSDEVSKGLGPYIERYYWVSDALDAVEFTRLRLLPLANIVRDLVRYAVVHSSSVDEALGIQIEKYSIHERGRTYAEQFLLRQADTTWPISKWKEERVITEYVLDSSLISELEKIREHGSLVAQILEDAEKKKDTDLNWTYDKIRPPRPRHRKQSGWGWFT